MRFVILLLSMSFSSSTLASFDFKMPEGVKINVKPGQNFTFDSQTGVFKDSSGKPILPPPGSYEVELPKTPGSANKNNSKSEGNNSSAAAQRALDPQGKVRAPSNLGDNDPGGVSNYAPPKGSGTINTSTINHSGVSMDRVKVSQQKPISLFTQTARGPKQMSVEMQNELSELKSVLQGAVSKARALQASMQSKAIKIPDYQNQLRNEVLPHVTGFESKVAHKKSNVHNNSYYQGILNEQLDICRKLTSTLLSQARAPASTTTSVPSMNRELDSIERRILLLAVKYQVMETE